MSGSKQSRGGAARATSLSPSRRKQIASDAAKRRWEQHRETDPLFEESEATDPEIEIIQPDKAMPIAEWRGVLTLIGVDVPCYVLNDGQKIIGRVSATEVLTGIKGGGALEKYIGVKANTVHLGD